jgi:hypothetical protein
MWTIDMIKEVELEKNGGKWFSRGAMRFFGTTVYPDVWDLPDGALFVTGDRRDDDVPERYTVRRFWAATGTVETVGDFQAYTSLPDVKAAAAELAPVLGNDHE